MIVLKRPLMYLQRLSVFPFVSELFALSFYRMIRRDALKSLSLKSNIVADLGLASVDCLFP